LVSVQTSGAYAQGSSYAEGNFDLTLLPGDDLVTIVEGGTAIGYNPFPEIIIPDYDGDVTVKKTVAAVYQEDFGHPRR
jgi:hypothetical protein